MGLWKSLVGVVRVRIISADTGALLTNINNAGIILEGVISIDDLTVEATVLRFHCARLRKIVQRNGSKLDRLGTNGLYWTVSSLKKRPILICGLALYAVLAIYLPTRIFFVTVTGNDTISSETIISQAENVGIRFGASRRVVRSERMKNALLSAVPELQWSGVNTYGCVAVITVRERSQSKPVVPDYGVHSIVAKRDSVIQEMTVTKGNALCKVGQAVKAGQILVSGYTDCGISIKATSAEAEIYGQTVRHLTAVSPLVRTFRHTHVSQDTKYSLIIGKKLIKLYKDSGISGAGCVKMYQEHYLTLPGGFRLPVAFVAETCITYTNQTEILPAEDVLMWTSAEAEDFLEHSMVAGRILSAKTDTQITEDVLLINGEYDCLEMIGQIYNEEIIKGNEQRNGKNRKCG